MKAFPQPTRIAVAVAIALLNTSVAMAQQAPAKEDNSNAADGLKLDSVVVTATTTKVSKMKQSISVSGLNADQILQQAPTNVAEVLKSIPGIRSESSAGESNANITVRGVPIATGGAPYVQFQVDGLPVMQFGDIAFGNADGFVRFDNMLDYLEVVRGGSASTMATNSPGGVINLISKTGEIEGGSIGLTKGVDHDLTRYDFDYGGKINDSTRFQLGGFYRSSETEKDTNFTAARGGQFSANITKDLQNGYVRLSARSLDDRTPTYLPVPTRVVGGTIEADPRIDPRTAFFINSKMGRDVTRDRNDQLVSSDPTQGVSVKSDSFGGEVNLNLANGWNLNNKFRTTDNSGRWMGMFSPSGVDTAANVAKNTGLVRDRSGNGKLYYAYDVAGAKAGSEYTGDAFVGVLFNVDVKNLGLTANDLKMSKAFNTESGKITATGGLYHSVQDVDLVWSFNTYILSARNSNNDYLVTDPNQRGDLKNQGTNATFGGCCGRDISATYTTTSPYVGLAYETGAWNFDGSVRSENMDANGFSRQVNPTSGLYADGTRQAINYSKNEVGYSFGANYAFDRNVSAFGRTSKGYKFGADRVMFNANYDLTRGSTVPVDEIQQHEVGLKYRSGGFSAFTTVFQADTAVADFDPTTIRQVDNKYKAQGVEVEAAYRLGGWRVQGGITFTDAEITKSTNAGEVGKTPKRQADYVYQLATSYATGDHMVGGSLIGTTDSFANDTNTVKLKGYNTLNAFYEYKLSSNTRLGLAANNLTNELGFTEGDGANGRSITGRNVKASLKYTF